MELKKRLAALEKQLQPPKPRKWDLSKLADDELHRLRAIVVILLANPPGKLTDEQRADYAAIKARAAT